MLLRVQARGEETKVELTRKKYFRKGCDNLETRECGVGSSTWRGVVGSGVARAVAENQNGRKTRARRDGTLVQIAFSAFRAVDSRLLRVRFGRFIAFFTC
jgi:hypothetical protein